jgi:hypothetical protein
MLASFSAREVVFFVIFVGLAFAKVENICVN